MNEILITIHRAKDGTVTAKCNSDNLIEVFGLMETAKMNYWDQVKAKNNDPPPNNGRIKLLH